MLNSFHIKPLFHTSPLTSLYFYKSSTPHLSALLSVLLGLLYSDQLGPVHSDEGRHLATVRGALVKLLAQLKGNTFNCVIFNIMWLITNTS